MGYTLDEISNDITRQTKAAFEPSLDYVVVKIPRWAFEKFPGADSSLGPQMKSVGEVMSLGRTFDEALQKAVQSLETGVDCLDGTGPNRPFNGKEAPQVNDLVTPTPFRLYEVFRALKNGITPAQINEKNGMDIWFLEEILRIADMETELASLPGPVGEIDARLLYRAKRMGFADTRLARLLSRPEKTLSGLDIRMMRKKAGVLPTYQQVDTCAAEFEAYTPYLYSAYEIGDEATPTKNPKKILILGSGPNRIGQGIEFDYCCCQAAFALSKMGYEVIMHNCNPETVSTDYDTSDRLYFEPMTFEHVMNVVERENPLGVVLQLGGQTPLNLADSLEIAGVPILGTSPASIRLAEDREEFSVLLEQLDIPHPEYGIARSLAEGQKVAEKIGYPVLVRPSFVLGGRAMAIVGDRGHLGQFMRNALDAAPGKPVLIDRFMEDAYEIDVDALSDGSQVVVGAIMQHIEEAGVHSGDSACVLPPYKVSSYHLHTIREYTHQLGMALKVIGILNVQFAIKEDVVYVIEVNPRASRTVPYASKATGLAMARIASQLMVGKSLAELGITPGSAGGRLLCKRSCDAVQEIGRGRYPSGARDAFYR